MGEGLKHASSHRAAIELLFGNTSEPKQKRVNLLDGRRVFDVGIEAPFVPPHRQVASLSSLIGQRRGQQGPQGTDDHAEQGGQLIEKTVHGKSLPSAARPRRPGLADRTGVQASESSCD